MRVSTRSIGFVCLSAFVITALACAGAGRKWDTTHANDVQNGVQDKAQIESWIGQPHQVAPIAQHASGCTERWTHVHAFSKWGGAQTTTDTLVVDFDSCTNSTRIGILASQNEPFFGNNWSKEITQIEFPG